MSKDKNRQDQPNRSGNLNETVEVDYIVATYDVSPAEAQEAIRECGNNRSQIDDYLKKRGKSSRDKSQQRTRGNKGPEV